MSDVKVGDRVRPDKMAVECTSDCSIDLLPEV